MKLDSVLAIILLSVFFYTSQLFLSPVYLFFTLFIVLVFAYFTQERKSKVDYNFYMGLLGLIYSAVLFFNATDFGTYINFLMCVALLIFYPLLYRGHKIEVTKVVYFAIFILLLLYLSEAVYRFMNPLVSPEMLKNTDESLLFYQFKFNSIMFTDSNFVALSLICLLYFFMTLLPKGYLKVIIIFSVLVLILLTLSRAAYISTIFLLFMHYAKLKYKVMLGGGFLFLFVILSPYIFQDGSFMSKLKIIKFFIVYLEKTQLITLLIGSGIGSSADVLGIGSHNLFVLLVVEFGFIGLFWFLIYVLYNVLFSSFKTLPYWGAILLCGFSLGSMYAFVFLPALVATYDKNKKYDKK